MCDFSTGFRPPEMVKVRPVVVVSKRKWNRRTCIVVPCSAVASVCTLRVNAALPQRKYQFLARDSWAKCDCPYTISVKRLSVIRDDDGSAVNSRRTRLDDSDLRRIRKFVGKAIGLLDDDASP